MASSGDVAGRADEIPDEGSTIEIGPDERMQCEVDGTELRGIEVEVAKARGLPPHGRSLLHVAVHTPDGTLTGERLLSSLGTGGHRVAVTGEDLPRGGRFGVEVWLTGLDGTTVLRARDGKEPVRRSARMMSACGWSSPRPGRRCTSGFTRCPDPLGVAQPTGRESRCSEKALAEGLPDDTVILEDPKGPVAEGGAAAVGVLEDSPERIAVQVNAERGGYLVVADALVRDGWTARSMVVRPVWSTATTPSPPSGSRLASTGSNSHTPHRGSAPESSCRSCRSSWPASCSCFRCRRGRAERLSSSNDRHDDESALI